MGLRINQNVTSLATYSNLSNTTNRMEKSIAKLSSGLRINTAADDAAGLAISEKMRSQVRGLNRAKLNAQDGVSMLQVAEGGLNETESIIQRMRELAIQGSNDTLTSNDRLEIQKEINQLRDAIDDISHNTEFNTKKLLNGSQTAQITSTSSFISGNVTSGGVNGGDYKIDMKVIQGGIAQMQQTQIFMDKNYADKLATGATKLKDIAQFYDENGVFALSNPQQLTINGNSNSTSFTIDGEMTLNQLAAGLQNAIAGASGLGLRNSEAKVISTVQSGVSGLGGYIQLTSGTVGEMGDFSIAGDQAVMDALGVNVTRESINNVVQVRSQDVNGNVRTVNTSSDRASGLLNGIDMIFDNTAAQIAGHGGIVDGMKFVASATLEFKFQMMGSAGSPVTIDISQSFSANSTWSLDSIAAAINNKINATYNGSTAAGPESGCQASVVDGQIRISYTPNASHPTLQSEIEIVDDGGVLGFTAGTYNGFVDGDKDDEYAIKGISLVDASQATNTPLTIGIEDGAGSTATITLGNSVTALGTADIVEVNKFVMSANSVLASSGVTARIDIHDGSIAFTSTNMGAIHNGTAGSTACLIKVNSSDVLNTTLGYKDGTAKGTGDTNFRLRVVDNSPMLQIGANEGQNMQVAIGDMSARALGIDRLDMSTVKGAQDAIGKLGNALSRVSAERSKLGAYSNRLDYTMNNLENTATNLSDAESRIRDVDMASEMINFTSAQIMQQAGTAMLAQANSMGQSVLSLLG